MRIEITRAILMTRLLRFAEKFDHLFLHVLIFGSMFRESRGFISVPVTSSYNFVSFTNYIGINWNKIFVLYQRYVFLLGNLIYEQKIKFRDLLRNNNK